LLKLELEKVKPNVWNCNFLTDGERRKLKRQMSISGPEKTPPIMVRLIDGAYEIVDGEQRCGVAGELGWQYINAVQVEAEDSEAKALCLSYNHLRGRINWFKLCDIMDEDVREACKGVLNHEEMEKVLSLRNVDASARRLLETALLQGSQLTLEHLHLISTFPKEYQRQAAEKAVKYQAGVGELKALIERLVKPFSGEPAVYPPPTQTTELEGLGKPEKAEGRGEEALTMPRDAKAEAPKPEEKTVKAEEAEAFFTCECGRAYTADWEARKILRVKERGGVTISIAEETFPTMLRAKCPKCGLQGQVDVESGEIRWQLHA
jgi:hypothetical protein